MADTRYPATVPAQVSAIDGPAVRTPAARDHWEFRKTESAGNAAS